MQFGQPMGSPEPRERFPMTYPAGHFYSPVPDLFEIRAKAARLFDRSVRDVPGIELNVAAQLALLDEMADFYADMPFPHHQTPDHRFWLDNGYFSYGDAIVLYGMMRKFQPKRIIEIGSGFSSAAMLDVNDRFFGGNIALTCIEPHPERLQQLFRPDDFRRCLIVQAPIQNLTSDGFRELAAHDFLFIDSSHVAKVGSDVVHLVFNVLPMLAPGTIIHFHDMLWPFEYPGTWFEHGRAWNECYLLRAFLQYNQAFEILYFNSYLEIHHEARVAERMPLALTPPSSDVTPGNTSLWLRKRL